MPKKLTYNQKMRALEKNKNGIDFKFSEDRILADLQEYVEARKKLWKILLLLCY